LAVSAADVNMETVMPRTWSTISYQFRMGRLSRHD